jgi:hypothetical protein
MDLKNARVVYHITGVEEAIVRRGVEYCRSAEGPLTLDLYYPGDTRPGAQRLPAVVIVLGYADSGVTMAPGWCQFREMGMIVSWCRLFAASGMVGIAYETSDPAHDAVFVLAYLREHSAELGIDERRIGVWAGSGNAPVALSVLMDGKARCGVLFCGMTLDLGGATGVADASRQYRFANPTAGRRVEDLPKDASLFLARGGQDEIRGLNDALDCFVAEAVRCNLPITFMNQPSGPHGFDYVDDSEDSKQVIRAALAFLQAKLAE